MTEEYTPRRPIYDDEPDGYLESDFDYVMNNVNLAVELLDKHAKGIGPASSFFTNMQKRGDGKIYADLHKTDERIYFTPEDAQKKIDDDPELKGFRHVVEMVAMTRAEYDELVGARNET